MKFFDCSLTLADGQVIQLLARDKMELIHYQLLCQKLGIPVKAVSMET